MKILLILFMIFLLIVGAITFFLFPFYKTASEITKHKTRFNIISATKGHAIIDIKPPLYAGEAAIIPLNTKVTVATSSIDVDMSDRSTIRFAPHSEFKISQKSKKSFGIDLVKGSIVFKRTHDGTFKAVKTPKGLIRLKGTVGRISENSVQIIEGKALAYGSIKLSAGEAVIGDEKTKLDNKTAAKINKILADMKTSSQKELMSNLMAYVPVFNKVDVVDKNTKFIPTKPEADKAAPSSPETKTKPAPEDKENPLSRLIKDILEKKLQVYYDMYLLRMAITTDRYFNYDLTFPQTIEELNDEYASKLTHDPWETHYLYTLGGPAGFNLRSAGPDTNMNTSDDIVLFAFESPHVLWKL